MLFYTDSSCCGLGPFSSSSGECGNWRLYINRKKQNLGVSQWWLAELAYMALISSLIDYLRSLYEAI